MENEVFIHTVFRVFLVDIVPFSIQSLQKLFSQLVGLLQSLFQQLQPLFWLHFADSVAFLDSLLNEPVVVK